MTDPAEGSAGTRSRRVRPPQSEAPIGVARDAASSRSGGHKPDARSRRAGAPDPSTNKDGEGAA